MLLFGFCSFAAELSDTVVDLSIFYYHSTTIHCRDLPGSPGFPTEMYDSATAQIAAKRRLIGGTDIQIKMFDDHFVVESPGILPGIVRVNNIREFHFSRNPKIIDFLIEYEYVKEFGEGVDRVYRDMEEAGLPEPNYRQSEFMLYATLKNKNWGKEDAAWETDHHLGGDKGDEKGDENRKQFVLEIIKRNPKISIVGLAQETGLTKRQIERTIDTLKTDGKLRRDGPAKGGTWVVTG